MVFMLALLAWILGFSLNEAYVIPTTYIENGTCHILQYWSLREAQAIFGIAHVILIFFVPLAIMIFCYSHIAIMLHRYTSLANRRVHGHTDQIHMNKRKESSHEVWTKAHQNTIQTLMLVSVVFTLCWAANQVLFLRYNLGYSEDLHSPRFRCSEIAVYFNCCVNPVIYCFMYKHFQDEVKRLLSRCANTITQYWALPSSRPQHSNSAYATSSV